MKGSGYDRQEVLDKTYVGKNGGFDFKGLEHCVATEET
ncbi:hypothetical protein LEP1GSC193_2863 [Leptospira alstonii serovar Pingchang str. 80-412]|uniref:Uncharacterized protein n=2 Tax=Leptospira alstonii TaxID=28452 RepID=M6CWU0_9LEPT|nr:hypothetical protein LEP1GSC194_3301 [Leptospira alstonii serovar Sichuan str. 79601]EQA81711.1 hypothetical protein LEP1GSC193_2863 [Leptospira alstonii serovar Pingchang str. 80-412]